MSDRSKLTFAVVFLLLLFLGGVGSGIAVDRLWLLGPGGRPPFGKKMLRGHPDRLTQRFASRLELDEAQIGVVRSALEKAHRAMRAIRAENRPRMDAITEEARAKISSVLNETQKAEFDRMAAERGAFGRGFRGRGPPPFDGLGKRRFRGPPGTSSAPRPAAEDAP